MNEMNEGEEKLKLEVGFNALTELLEYQSRVIVGKVLKRFDIIENREVLKLDVKELLYEEMRGVRDLIVSIGLGYSQKIFQFNNKNNKGDVK